MSEATLTETHGGHAASSTGLSNNKLAMWLFLGSECLLFGGLISTYMLYRGRHVGSPGPAQLWDIPLTSVSSFVLLMSSLTMVLAVSAAQQRDDRLTNLWLSVTALLGATFVGAQVFEFTTFYHEGVGFTTSLFSSSFYTLTGFHGIHVTVGALGSEARTFRLDVNGTIGYADLSTAEVNTRGQWVLMEVDINRADIHEPQNLHEWATNDLHLEYSTDRTSLTLEDHSLTYRITAY